MGEPEGKTLVLVVDDDEDHLTMLEAALQGAGYQVVTASSRAAARRENDAHAVDALVADLTLNDGTAIDLLRDLGARRPRVAVVLTGFDTAEDVERTRAAGFVAHLVKPTSIDELARVLDNALQRAASSPRLAKARGVEAPASKRSAG